MRILRVAQKLYPSVVGGGAYHVHAMSRDQAAAGHDVTVLTVTEGEETAERIDRDGYTVVRCRASVDVLGNTIAPGVVGYLRSADEYDVVHAHSHLYFSTNLAAVTRRLTDTPLAITNHGLYSQSAPEWLFGAYLRTVGRWTFNTADLVFCYSDATRDRIRDLGVHSDIAVVPNGIDTSRFTPNGPESDLIDPGPAVLFVGRLAEGKRPEDTIEAMVDVRDQFPDATIYLAGDGERKAALTSLASEREIGDAVRFLGHVAYDEMPRLYRAADVLVLPSRAEGTPRTVLEALATETPVVTSDLPQLRPLTDKAGIAVPIGDRDALAEAIVALIADSERTRRLGARGRELVTERHRWETTVEQTTERLAHLAGE